MAINERVQIMREAIVKLTQMLAGKGIRVTQSGIGAFVRADKNGKPELVNLPQIPDNANEALIDAIHGFLDHEVAHILFTEFTAMNEAQRFGAGSMLNIIEDARIERAMAERFQGSAENISRMGRFFLDKYTKPELDKALAAGDAEQVTALLTVPLIRMMAGQDVFKEFMDDKMEHVEELYDTIKDLAPKIKAAKSTRDCLVLAKEVMKRIKGAVEESEEPGGTGSTGKGSKSGRGKAGGKGGSGGGGGAEMSAPGGEDEDEEEPGGEEEEGGADGGGDEDDGSGEAPAGDGSDDVGTTDDEEEGGMTSTSGKPKGGGSGKPKSSAMSWEKIDKETARDFDETVSDLIGDSAAAAASDADYLVFTKDNDVIEPLHVGKGYKPTMLTEMDEEVGHMVGPLQKDLERAISARSLASWQPGHRSGRLNAANLSRLAVNDDRVFRRKQEVRSKDVAVELLIDMSGSMTTDSKIKLAAETAYALAQTLERIGIVCEVICFTTGHARPADATRMADDMKKLGRPFSRVENLYMPILKGYGERFTTEIRQRFAWLPNVADCRNNVDGESVEIAGRRLQLRREKGKVLIVLSDGYPSASGDHKTLGPHLKKVVDSLSKSGVNVVGIGIKSDAVREFYPKSAIIQKVEELPNLVMKELRSLIVH